MEHRDRADLGTILQEKDDSPIEAGAADQEGNADLNDQLVLLQSLFSVEDLSVLEAVPPAQIIEILGRVIRGEDYREAMKATAPVVVEQIAQANESQNQTISAAENPEDAIRAHDESTGHVFMDSEFTKLALFTPLRLSHTEREYLRLVEGAIKVSEYTDRVDIIQGSRMQRIAREIKQICKVLTGLIVAHNYQEGKQLLDDNDFTLHADVFQTLFEITRRYKILNPEMQRDAYGKVVYLLMDARKPQIQELIGFDLVRPIVTVKDVVEMHGIEAMLTDDRLKVATMEIIAGGRPRDEVDRDRKLKQAAIKGLSQDYSNYNAPSRRSGLSQLRLQFSYTFLGGETEEDPEDELNARVKGKLTPEGVEQIIYSFGDHHSHILQSVYPIDRLIDMMDELFDENGPTNEFNGLSIQSGRGGARLTHDHHRQYLYVKQTLTFWKMVLKNFYFLWNHAEKDLLTIGNQYRLMDTGQGLNRVQRAPCISQKIQTILNHVKQEMGYWIGSDMVHLGDHNVPNALMFIDKYTQVPRIITTLEKVLNNIPQLYESPLGENLRQTFGPVEQLQTVILSDFFRHGFDGSGADNFFDAGSCIDGRLTSAWNWCSLIHKKHYYQIFQLAGFASFDGQF